MKSSMTFVRVDETFVTPEMSQSKVSGLQTQKNVANGRAAEVYDRFERGKSQLPTLCNVFSIDIR